MTVYQQHRSVDAGGVSLDGLDVEVSVRKPKDDPLEFEVTTWNLTEDSWSQIAKGDLCRVELGWGDGPSETVVVGKIDTRKRDGLAGGVEYTLAGVDKTEAATKVNAEPQTFQNKTPDRIASALVSSVGLSASAEPVDSPIKGTYAVTDDKTVAQWLDDLLQIAANKTGVEWEWFASRGQVFFQPRNGEASSAPELSYDGMLSSIGEAGETDDDMELIEFEAVLDPRISKGAVLSIGADGFSGAYRVSEFEFISSTVSGDHEVKGKLTPVDADYSIE